MKVVKNKVAPPFRVAEFDIIYGEGISRVGDLLDLALTQEIIEKYGSWYSWGDIKLGQGRENAKDYLRANPETADKLEGLVREKLGLTQRTTGAKGNVE